MERGTDKWWTCDTPEAINKTIEEIKKVLSGEIIPFFDSAGSDESIRSLIEGEKFNFMWHNPFTFSDKGFFYLYAKDYNKGLQVFQTHQPSKVPKFKTIKALIDQQNFIDVDKILEDNIKHTKQKLEI